MLVPPRLPCYPACLLSVPPCCADIAESLGVGANLVVAERLQDSDAVLALRGKIKTSEAVLC